MELFEHQKQAIKKLKTGSILCGDVGSGKSLTALAYYFKEQGGYFDGYEYIPADDLKIKDLYIITTARKRDTLEWWKELNYFLLTPEKENRIYKHEIIIDSWNNIGKYSEVKGAFFIFDEQRLVGSGAWVKSFLKIAKSNDWILLSATPGDTWSDYIPVFIANGFYKNKTDFSREHIVYSRFTKFPQVDRYINTRKLERFRDEILVRMDFDRDIRIHHLNIKVDYNKELYKDIRKNRWNYETNEPISNVSEFCYILRKIINSDNSRILEIQKIIENKHKVIIFYNFDYELKLLKNELRGLKFLDYRIAEWNGHRHQSIPDSEKWIYLVQYTAGAEGWNCIETDTIIFYSQNYSYKIMHQAAGRINRMNTPFRDLYYYHLKSEAHLDLAIHRALREKKNFNERKFVK